MITALIVPCYNEEKRLQKERFTEFVLLHSDIDLWFVNDGSTDNTLGVINELSQLYPDRIHVYSLPQNRGKAEAVRLSFLHVVGEEKYNYIGFIDADLSAPLSQALLLLKIMKKRELLLVTGARVKLVGSEIERNVFRYYIGRIFTTYYDTLLRLSNYDTQCGLKMFDRSVVKHIFEKPFLSKWLFDVEIFLRIQHLLGREGYHKKVKEVPLSIWKETGGSKLKLTDFLKAPFEILKIYREYRSYIRK